MNTNETLEEAAHEYFKRGQLGLEKASDTEKAFSEGAKWQAKRMYSEEDMKLSHKMGAIFAYGRKEATSVDRELHFKEWFIQFKKPTQ